MSLLHKGRITNGDGSKLFGMPLLDEIIATDSHKCMISLGKREEIIEKTAYARGFSVGEEAGLKVGEQKAAVLLEKLREALEGYVSFIQGFEGEMEAKLLELAVAIARKVVKEELSTNRELIVMMVKEALNKIVRTGPVTIRISPSMKPIFEKLKPELLDIHPEIIFDFSPSASKTGPIVVGPEEEIVVDVDSQIDNIFEEIGSSNDKSGP